MAYAKNEANVVPTIEYVPAFPEGSLTLLTLMLEVSDRVMLQKLVVISLIAIIICE
jgi:hypothetical protein